jgi:hypothetical protein
MEISEITLASECDMTLEEYQKIVYHPNTIRIAIEEDLTPHEFLKSIAKSNREYFKKEKAKIQSEDRDHFFVLLDKDGNYISERTHISTNERNAFIKDFVENHNKDIYVKGVVDFATDLDLGTKININENAYYSGL